MTHIPQSTTIRLVSKLLELSANAFEFPLATVIPDVGQRRELVAAVHAMFSNELGAFDPERTYETWNAWYLARWAARTTAREAGTFEAFELAAKNGITIDERAIKEMALRLASSEALSDGELLAYLGTDAQRWARSCVEHAHAADKCDEEFLFGWFANAIEAGKSAGISLESARIVREFANASADSARAAGVPVRQWTFDLSDAEPTNGGSGRCWKLPEGKTLDELNAQLAKDFAAPIPVAPAELDIAGAAGLMPKPGERVFRRSVGSRWDGLETDEELRTRIKLELDNGVGPGTEFPNLTASKLVATHPDGTTQEGIAIHRRDLDVETHEIAAGTYAPPLVGAPFELVPCTCTDYGDPNCLRSQAAIHKLREIACDVIEKLQCEQSKLPMTRKSFDMIELRVQAEGTFPIVAVELYDDPAPGAFPSIRVTTMSGGREIEVVIP